MRFQKLSTYFITQYEIGEKDPHDEKNAFFAIADSVIYGGNSNWKKLQLIIIVITKKEDVVFSKRVLRVRFNRHTITIYYLSLNTIVFIITKPSIWFTRKRLTALF
ncbi:MAG: hypothetical protein ABI168_03445 [Ginsengibacter sp.]